MFKKTNIDAIRSLVPDTAFSYDEDKVIEWDISDIKTGKTQPTEAEIDVEVVRLQAEFDSLAYSRARKTAYDALNQFELISDDSINGTTTHKDAIAKIKSDHPKT
jgi:hypothetical protein